MALVDRKRYGGWASVWNVDSESTPNKTYLVVLGVMFASCSCPDHLYRGRECKHIMRVRAFENDVAVAVAEENPDLTGPIVEAFKAGVEVGKSL